MPQLNTTHIFLTFVWTWLSLCLITQKTKMLLINKTPTKTLKHKTKNPMPALPWT